MTLENWSEDITRALTNVVPDAMKFYAGDDRLRRARKQAGRTQRMRKAGVLMPIIALPCPRIVLTQRSASLRSHPGQISFPGGRVEPGDADTRAAAIRETHEEIGVQPPQVEVLGRLPDYVTGTGYDITPFVGRLPEASEFVPDGREVARVFTVPLAYVLDSTNFRRDTIPIDGVGYEFHAIEYEGNYIWGATAAMLYGLCESLRLTTTAS